MFKPSKQIRLTDHVVIGQRMYEPDTVVTVSADHADRILKSGKGRVHIEGIETAKLPNGAARERAAINPRRRPAALTVRTAEAYEDEAICSRADGEDGPLEDETDLEAGATSDDPELALDPKTVDQLTPSQIRKAARRAKSETDRLNSTNPTG